MVIFHVCNNYIASKVHSELILRFKIKKIKQAVYVPVREQKGNEGNEGNDNDLEVFFDYIIKPSIIKLFPLIKVMRVFSSIYFNYKDKIKKSDLLLAHTFWSDGIHCLIIKLIFKKKYIVCVRNTDLNVFMKYLLPYKFIFNMIAKNAQNIIFISKANYNQGIENYSYIKKNNSKIKIIPNGINDYWLENISIDRKYKNHNSKELNLIYAGRLDENKNLKNTYLACTEINKKNSYNLSWTIVGGNLSQLKSILDLDTLPSWIRYKPKTENLSVLRDLFYKSDLFIMPSYKETFGLVYVEAITQGCKCICSAGQGIAGFFDDYNLIQYCNPNDIYSIKNAIELAHHSEPRDLDTLPSYIRNNFSWDTIANKYLELF